MQAPAVPSPGMNQPGVCAQRLAFSARLAGWLLAGLALLVWAGAAVAQRGYPNRAITLIVPTAPGGTTDIAARMLAEPLGAALGQTVIVDNRAGANGNVGALTVKRAEPDGYTLLMQYSGYHVISPLLRKQPPQWEPQDLLPVANVLNAPQVIVVRDGLPVKTLAELIAYAKANPGKLRYASSGNGSLLHMTGAMLEQQAGIQMTHVPFTGTAPALRDVLGAKVDLTFGTPPPFIAYLKDGKLRALAVTGKTRLTSLPNVPTTAEAGLPRLDPISWFAVYAPARTPPAVVDKLTAAIGKVLATPDFQHKAVALGASADYLTPPQLAAQSTAEAARWAQLIRESKIEAD